MIGVIALAAAGCAAGYFFLPTKYEKANETGWEVMAKMGANLSVQAKSEEQLEQLEKSQIRKIDIPFINKEGTVVKRPMWLYMPKEVNGPVPVVYIPHYEMKEDALETHLYTERGWAVAAPADFQNAYNGQMQEDDLVFNNAAIYTLKHMEEIDQDRFMLIGGSAGGYMTLMLNALQTGFLASIANVPISNYYYLNQYFLNVDKLNKPWKTRAKVRGLLGLATEKGANKLLGFLKGNYQLPVPWVGIMGGMFEKTEIADDLEYWEAFSPVALAADFTSPIMTSHNTSDVLVPLNQTSEEHSYDTTETMPKGYSAALDRSVPGPLGHTLLEELDSAKTLVTVTKQEADGKTVHAPFDENVMFNINIYDNGAPKSYGDHGSLLGVGQLDYTAYPEAMMKKTNRETEQLTKEKVLLLLERYLGKSKQLPPHENVDDTVYGSLAVYRKEVEDSFAKAVKDHTFETIDSLVREGIEAAAADREALAEAWSEILGKISERRDYEKR